MLQSTYPAYSHLNFITVSQKLRWLHTIPYSRGCACGQNASSLNGCALAAVGNELWHRKYHVLRATVLAKFGFPIDAGLECERMRIFDKLFMMHARHC